MERSLQLLPNVVNKNIIVGFVQNKVYSMKQYCSIRLYICYTASAYLYVPEVQP